MYVLALLSGDSKTPDAHNAPKSKGKSKER